MLGERGDFMQQVTNLQELETVISQNGEMVVTKNNKFLQLIISQAQLWYQTYL